MADNAQTKLDWIITGLEQVKQMASAVTQLANAQRRLNAAIGAGGTQERIASATAHTATNTRVLVTLMKQQLALTRQIAGGTQNVATQTNNATRASKGLLLSWQSIGRIIIGSLISRGLGKLLREIREAATETAEFERRISELRTISQNSQLDFNQWADAVVRLSNEFNRQPLDIIEGLYQTLSNQVAEGTQAIVFMEEALRLSQITVSTTTQAVQALTAAINAYHYTVADARYVSDLFFKTVELGRLRLEDLSSTVGRVYVLGSQLGVTLKELNASLAGLTIQGVPASEAMTWLRNVMIKLIRPTERFEEILAEWGVTSGQSAIRTWGWIGVLQKLKEEVSKGNDELKELADIFNRIRATTGAAGLVGNLKTIEEALEGMETAAKDAAEAFDLIRESVGFKMQQELQRVSNFFTIELGRNILAGIYDFTEALGGMANAIKVITYGVIALGAALAVTFAASMIAQIGMMVWQFGNVASAAGLAAAATAALNTQVMVLGFSFNALTLGIGAAVAAIGLIAYGSWRIFKEAEKGVLGLTDAMKDKVLTAYAEQAAKENEINAARVRAASETAIAMSRPYLQAIADQKSALLELERIEMDRTNLESLLFDMKMKTASTAEKERLIYERLLALREELNFELGKEQRDWETINKIQKELLGTYGLASQFSDKIFRAWYKVGFSTDKAGRKQTVYVQQLVKGSARIENLMKNITAEVEVQRRAMDKIPVTTKEQLAEARKVTDEELQKAKVIEDVEQREKDVKAALEQTNNAQAEMLGNLRSRMNLMQRAYDVATSANILNFEDKLRYNIITGNAEWARRNEAVATFEDKMQQLTTLLDQTQEQGAVITPEQIALLDQYITQLEAAYAKLSDHIPIEKMGEFIAHLRSYLDVLAEMGTAKTSLELKLDILEQALRDGSLEAKWFKDNMKEIGVVGVKSQEQIVKAAATTTESLNRVLIWLRMSLRATNINIERLEVAIKKANELNAKTAGTKWTGGFATRFASGGSVASDTIPALLRPGEFIMNKDAARQYFPQLVSMNSGGARFSGGGEVVNNNIGDINVTVQGGDTADVTVRRIASSLRRELKRGTVRLS